MIETKRLILRYFELNDAKDMAELANDPSVYSTTLELPSPYTTEDAKKFIGVHEKNRKEGIGFVFAVTLKDSGRLIGCVGLRVNPRHRKAEIGYWIGKEFWAKGFCTEAAKSVMDFGFSDLGLRRIYAYHMVINPASGKVLEKLGMKREGYLREEVLKDGVPLDLVLYGILKGEWVQGGIRDRDRIRSGF